MQNIAIEDASQLPTAPTWSPGLVSSLVACISAGIAGLAIVHSIHPYFKFADLPELGIAPRPELVAQHQNATIAFWSNNFALDFAILGLCIGAAIGCLTARKKLASMLVGGMGGSLGGAASSYVLGTFIAKAVILSADQSLLQSTLFHFALWATLLMLAVVLVGLVQDGWRLVPKYALAGIGMGLVVSVLYNLAASVFFSHSNLLMLLPISTTERFVWIAICTSIIALGLHFGLLTKKAV